MRRPVLVHGKWSHGVHSWGADRDGYWVLAMELARAALEEKSRRCLACGTYLFSRIGYGRLYCDDTCRRRHGRRRERYRATLREHGEPCVFCGDDVD